MRKNKKMYPTQKIYKTVFMQAFLFVGAFSILGVLAFSPPKAYAQGALRIAAVVNDEMISVYDLKSRIALVAAFSGFENTAETQRRLAPQILQQLISERIRLQEAKELGVEAKDSEINNEKSALELQTKIKPGQLLKSLEANGIDTTTLLNQFKAKIVWSKMIRRKFSRNVQISDSEVDEAIDEIKRNKGKPEYLVSEILLPTESTEKSTESEQLAPRLVQQILDGANFAAIARNFSQSPSAQKGGNLGWNRVGQLGTELGSAIINLKPGQITNPVRTVDGIYILKLNKHRVSAGLDGPPLGPPIVSLLQFHLPIPSQSSPQQILRIKLDSQTLTNKIKGCNAFDEIAKASGSELSGELGTFRMDEISTQMQGLIKDLPVGKPSIASVISDSIIVLMVCNRQIPVAVKVDLIKIRRQIKNNLTTIQLSLAARRYQRDLRRAAFIEIRL